jgi:AcrR family transcriptional regulator
MRAASRLFWERGYAAVSVADIAAAVGITKATLYYHFSGKEAVYVAVMRHTLELIAAAIREIARTPLPVRERLRLLASGFLANAPNESNHDAMLRDVDQLLNPAAQADLAAAHTAMMDAYTDLMRDAIDRGELRDLDPAWLANTFQHLLDSIVLKRNAGFFPDRHAAAEALIDLFLHGTATSPPAMERLPDQEPPSR